MSSISMFVRTLLIHQLYTCLAFSLFERIAPPPKWASLLPRRRDARAVPHSEAGGISYKVGRSQMRRMIAAGLLSAALIGQVAWRPRAPAPAASSTAPARSAAAA